MGTDLTSTHLAGAAPGEAPPFLYYLSDSQLRAESGQALVHLAERNPAHRRALLDEAIAHLIPLTAADLRQDYQRSALLHSCYLTQAHLTAGDIESATQATTTALTRLPAVQSCRRITLLTALLCLPHCGRRSRGGGPIRGLGMPATSSMRHSHVREPDQPALHPFRRPRRPYAGHRALRRPTHPLRPSRPPDDDPSDYTPPHGLFLLLCLDNQPAGCGGYRAHGTTTGEIKRLYVRPEYRGRGHGRRILTALEDHAHTVGATCLLLETGVRNDAAISLFSSAGYTPAPGYVPNRDQRINRAFAKSLPVPQRL
ncbi:MAG: GNAT family N-acetyltransferase [Pseudonocardiaceae bacterium]